jgi:hypothetical protein
MSLIKKIIPFMGILGSILTTTCYITSCRQNHERTPAAPSTPAKTVPMEAQSQTETPQPAKKQTMHDQLKEAFLSRKISPDFQAETQNGILTIYASVVAKQPEPRHQELANDLLTIAQRHNPHVRITLQIHSLTLRTSGTGVEAIYKQTGDTITLTTKETQKR